MSTDASADADVRESVEMEKVEYRSVIKFLFLQGKQPKVIREEMFAVYGEKCPSYDVIKKWWQQFKCGRESVYDEERSGRPSTSRNETTVKKIEHLIMTNRRISIQEIVAETGVSCGSVEAIIHNDLKMSKVSARWIPRFLTDSQKERRMSCSQALLTFCDNDPDKFFARLVTMDESWIHHYDPESKEESKQWKHTTSPPPKKAKVQASAKKIMLSVFWDERGVLLTDYLRRGTTINAQYYVNLLQKLRDAIKTKRRGMLTKGVLLLQDNASSHTAVATTTFAAQCGYHILDHPAYSPDLAPSDYFLFPALKKFLRGKHFPSDEALISETESWFSSKNADFYKNGLRKCRKRWAKCVALQGDYIEKQ